MIEYGDTTAGLLKIVEFLERERIEQHSMLCELAAAQTAAAVQITSLETTLDQILRSRSWRLTKPLRAITRLAQNVRVRLTQSTNRSP